MKPANTHEPFSRGLLCDKVLEFVQKVRVKRADEVVILLAQKNKKPAKAHEPFRTPAFCMEVEKLCA